MLDVLLFQVHTKMGYAPAACSFCDGIGWTSWWDGYLYAGDVTWWKVRWYVNPPPIPAKEDFQEEYP